MIQITDQEFTAMYTYIRMHYGMNLEKKKFLIENKLWIELAKCKVTNYTEYWQKVMTDRTGELEKRMMDLLTVNYTYFCREEEHFDFLIKKVLPQISKMGIMQFEIWCGACATGQECYTLAMHLLDCQKQGLLNVPFHIFGTDLSEKAIHTAVKAQYGSSDYPRLKPNWKGTYVSEFKNGSFSILPIVREHVTFQRENLLQPHYSGRRFHIIFCRNVLIYFQEREQTILLEHLHQKLLPGGYLFISQTETIRNGQVPLDYIQPAVYQKTEGRTQHA